jgi:hypothetical protein
MLYFRTASQALLQLSFLCTTRSPPTGTQDSSVCSLLYKGSQLVLKSGIATRNAKTGAPMRSFRQHTWPAATLTPHVKSIMPSKRALWSLCHSVCTHTTCLESFNTGEILFRKLELKFLGKMPTNQGFRHLIIFHAKAVIKLQTNLELHPFAG